MKGLLIFSIVLILSSIFMMTFDPVFIIGLFGVVMGAALFTLSATVLDHKQKIKKNEQIKNAVAEKQEDYNVYLEDIDEMVEYLKESIYTYEESNKEISAELKTQLEELKNALENFNPIYGADTEDLGNEDKPSNETININQEEVKEEYIFCANCGMSNKKTKKICSSCGLKLK